MKKNKALIIFTRVPLPGKTKTRLMPFLNGDECAALHTCFLKDIYQKAEKTDAAVFVFYTPEDEKKLLGEILGTEDNFFPQEGEDLGERMKNAIDHVLSEGYEKAILVGTDIPQMEESAWEQAFDALDEYDIVIHPTQDGGYYLIGMKKTYESIWKVERYGTNTVIQDTLSCMKKAGLRVAAGQIYYDVDEKEDLCKLWKDIEKNKIKNCPVTERYLREHLAERLEKGE